MRYSKNTMDMGYKALQALYDSGKRIKVLFNGMEISEFRVRTVDTDIGYLSVLEVDEVTYLASVVEKYGRVEIVTVHPVIKRDSA